MEEGGEGKGRSQATPNILAYSAPVNKLHRRRLLLTRD